MRVGEKESQSAAGGWLHRQRCLIHALFNNPHGNEPHQQSYAMIIIVRDVADVARRGIPVSKRVAQSYGLVWATQPPTG